MNTNDAAEVLDWHEQRRKQWRERVLRDREASRPTRLGKSWKPTMTAEQKAAHDEYVRANGCPF